LEEEFGLTTQLEYIITIIIDISSSSDHVHEQQLQQPERTNYPPRIPCLWGSMRQAARKIAGRIWESTRVEV
jgi:hypothetical protein